MNVSRQTITNRVGFGVKTTPVGVGYEEIARVWVEADQNPAIESAWLWDHLMPLRGDPSTPLLEGWTLLTALAARTERLRLGLMVSNNLNRAPGLLAKMAATLDVISSGRLILGLGAGPNERMLQGAREAGVVTEADAYGVQLPATPAEASARLAETCAIVLGLWSGEAFDYDGEHNRLAGAVCRPRPAQRPHPPILIGGWADRTLRVVAEHADMWNLPGPPHLDVAALRERSAALDRHCAAVGRDPGAITRSTQLIVAYDGAGAARTAALELIDAGARHIVLGLPSPYPDGAVAWAVKEIVEPVLRERRELSVPPG